MLNVPVSNFGGIIQDTFEFADSVTFFTIVLKSKNGEYKDGKKHKEIDENPAAKGAMYNHKVYCYQCIPNIFKQKAETAERKRLKTNIPFFCFLN